MTFSIHTTLYNHHICQVPEHFHIGLMCLSLMTNDFEHIFLDLLTIYISSSTVCSSLLLLFRLSFSCWGFPGSSAGKESACSAGDPGSIPGSRRPTGEGIGYPLQYSWASLMAQQVKNLSAMWETWVWSPAWEDPLEKGKGTHSSILAWRIPWTV